MIKVTEKYYVEVGKDCCTIYENKLNKKDNTYYLSPVTYPYSFEKAIEKIMRYEYAEATNERDMSLTEALSTLKELRKEYQAILDEIREMRELR